DPRSKSTGAVISFGLRKIQQILAFYVARTHVIADSVADDLAAGIEHERQFRFGHAPFCVASDAHGLAAANDFFWQRLEEKLWPVRIINPVIGICAELGFLHARRFASQI